MENFNELSKDIIVMIDSLNYETKEENLLRSELIMNIGKFLTDEESYRKNITILNNAKTVEIKDNCFSDEVFNKVTTDIISSIASLNYQDKSMNILKVELMLNINRFLSTQKDYYSNISILNNLAKDESVLRYK